MKLKELISLSNSDLEAAIHVINSWIITSDSDFSIKEKSYLLKTCNASSIEYTKNFLNMTHSEAIKDIEFAIKTINNNYLHSEKGLVIEFFLQTVIADNRVHLSEIHIIRYLSDSLSVNYETINEMYLRLTGKDFPLPGDPSSLSWWKNKINSYNSDSFRKEKRAWKDINIPSHLRGAISFFNLDYPFTKEELRNAYRRMTKKYHPDKYQNMGEESVNTANIFFQEINATYEELKSL